MKKQGTVVRWDSEKAFGFIRCPQIPADVFFHLRDFGGPGKPTEGLKVMFEEFLSRYPHLEFAAQPRYATAIFVNQLTTFPVITNA